MANGCFKPTRNRALGPDIGWLDEGLDSISKNPVSIQIIYNLLEQEPSKTLLSSSDESDIGYIARVPHASGILDGNFDKDKVFSSDDHRSHRRQKWMLNGLKAKEDLSFLFSDNDRTKDRPQFFFLCLKKTFVLFCQISLIKMRLLNIQNAATWNPFLIPR